FTGEILAMAQAPNFSTADPFNPDYFTCPQLVEVWDSLSESQRVERVMTLWRNYHTTRSSEPSATFKPFVIAAAFEEGYIDSHSVFYCEGRRYINDQSVWCHNIWGCGMLSLRRSLYRSCNMAMVYINEGLGRDLFYQYRGYFGFGAQTGIGLPNEADVSSRYVMYPWARLHAVEMANSAMGQGFQATTMQMINGYAALINGGNLMRPFIVSQVINDRNIVVHENLPHVTRRAIAGETSNFIRNEMRYVVAMQPSVGELSGTGWRSYIEGVSIGGKTGTALQGDRQSYNYTLTYIAFFPVEDPQFLVLLTLDNPMDTDNAIAGYIVAPIVREFLVDLIEMKNLLT
ncbi:MAG: penicillin-binding transpeptidase domain-containing protein, partial [Defluviitaleaceae bacterium]|nr:penicillin-binding transpeptidase domain-containing protein [Defluviitaleaceae bacterium]